MSRTLLAAVVALVLASSVLSAQRVERTINLAAFGWGTIEAWPVDTDGVAGTEEWAIKSFDTNHWRVVAVRGTALCVGAWFAVSDGTNPFISAQIVRVGAVDKLRVGAGALSQSFTLVSLDTPACP